MALLTEKLLSDGGINFDLPILLGYSGTDASNLEKYRADSREIWQGPRGYAALHAAVQCHRHPYRPRRSCRRLLQKRLINGSTPRRPQTPGYFCFMP